ncbi:NF038122 family metalloprotease [Calothrix rhizosoleniae]|uniref:NF038122 family metalloprotease n=1 Tax=Calothrix rhizosoleniae TaxID=888997 RepID=UPI000B49B0BE|nr:NF038122 family metalloprotease [Calothrix rhizosoleniae]
MKYRFFPKINYLKQLAPIIACTTTLISNPAQAVTFNFTYTPDTRQEIIDGFEAAGDIWSSKLQDTYLDADCFCERDTIINLHVGFTQLPNTQGLGAARPAMLKVDYNQFLNNSFRDITSADDLTAFKNLQIDQDDKGFSEGFLQALGVDLKYNNYEQNLNILQSQGFSVDSNISGIKSNSNNIITAQAQDIFKQLDFEKLKTLNRNLIKFETSKFKMRVDDSSSVKFKHSHKADKIEKLNDNTVIDKNGNDNNKKIWTTRANAKALGLIEGDDDGFDGQILLSNSMLDANGNIVSYTNWQAQNPQGEFAQDSIWDFSRVSDPNAEVDSNKFDILSVAQHEIGHNLGFLSGVDAFKLLDTQAKENGKLIDEKDTTLVSTMDLYRFSEESKEKEVFDWSNSSNTFFSIDGGKTKLGNFADGTSYQTSHWSEKGDENGNPLGIMNPVIGRGEKLDITDLDLQVLDVIGWDRQEKLSDQTGLSELTKIAEGKIATKVRDIGLDWNKLEDLLTKPAAETIKQLSQERLAIAEFQIERLQNELLPQEAQLKAEEQALKVQREAKEDEIKSKEDEFSDLLKTEKDLLKKENKIKDDLASVQKKIGEQQAKLETKTKQSDRDKIQKEINKLQAKQDELQTNLEDYQTQQQSLQLQLAELNDLRQKLANLQTTPSIEAMTQAVNNLKQELNAVQSLEKYEQELANKADKKKVKSELDKIEKDLDKSLKKEKDGIKRAELEEEALQDLINTLVKGQDEKYTQLMNGYQVLLSGVELQVRQWLEGSAEQLQEKLATASLQQTATLLDIVKKASREQKDIWEPKLTQAIMLMNQVDEKTAEKQINHATNSLDQILKAYNYDMSRSSDGSWNSGWGFYMSRISDGYWSSGWGFWQEMDTKKLSSSEYAEKVHTGEDGIENGYSMFFNQEYSNNHQSTDVPEPSMMAGLGIMGLFGWLRRRRCKD